MKKIFTLCAIAMMAMNSFAQEVITDYTFDWSTQKSFTMWAPDEIKNNFSVTAEGLSYTNEKATTNFWDLQHWVASDIELETGVKYKYTIEAKAIGSGKAVVRTKLGDWSTGLSGSFEITAGEDFKKFEIEGDAVTGSGSFILVQYGDFVGTVIFRSVVVSHVFEATADDYMVQVDLKEAKKNNYESQLLVTLPKALEVGKKYDMFVSVKGTGKVNENGGLGSMIEDTKSSNKDEWGNSADLQYTNNFEFTSDWQEVSLGVSNGTYPYDRIILQLGQFAGTLYFDNFKFIEQESKEVILVDFKTGIAKIASKRDYHTHVSVSKTVSDLPAGLNAVAADNDKAVMYNILGQRVNNAKGLVIINGKKVIVK